MKWYGLIALVCLIMIGSFAFSASTPSMGISPMYKVQPKVLTEDNAKYLTENNLTDYDLSEIVCETDSITLKELCKTKMTKEGKYNYVLTLDTNGRKDEDIQTAFKELANQRLNTFASIKIEQQRIIDAKAKNTIRIIGEKKTVIIASATDEKGDLIQAPKVDEGKAPLTKSDCWISLLGWCIWK